MCSRMHSGKPVELAISRRGGVRTLVEECRLQPRASQGGSMNIVSAYARPLSSSRRDAERSRGAPTVNPTVAIVAVNRSGEGAIYTGLAVAANGTGNFFTPPISTTTGSTCSIRASICSLAGELFRSRASGRVRAVRYPEHLGNLYVTYAKQDEAAQRDVPGPGLGFVSVFDANGYINGHRPSDSRYVRFPLSSAEPRRQRHDGQGVIQMTWVIDASQCARAVRGRTRRGAHRRDSPGGCRRR